MLIKERALRKLILSLLFVTMTLGGGYYTNHSCHQDLPEISISHFHEHTHNLSSVVSKNYNKINSNTETDICFAIAFFALLIARKFHLKIRIQSVNFVISNAKSFRPNIKPPNYAFYHTHLQLGVLRN